MDCIFCEFINKRLKKHRGNYPFKILHETEHSLSFLSIDFPATEDGHILVIPKKHYVNYEDIPNKILLDLFKHIKLITKALRIENQGNNLLLNNGAAAGQYIFHTHFHIIPRNDKDNIKIEVWKRKEITKEDYNKLHKKIKDKINQILL